MLDATQTSRIEEKSASLLDASPTGKTAAYQKAIRIGAEKMIKRQTIEEQAQAAPAI